MTEEIKQSLSPTTTSQEDLTIAGQRRINLVWEFTQSTIAVLITLANIYCAVMKITSPELNNGLFLIVGFYFARTNHQNIGGVGFKATDNQTYVGR